MLSVEKELSVAEASKSAKKALEACARHNETHTHTRVWSTGRHESILPQQLDDEAESRGRKRGWQMQGSGERTAFLQEKGTAHLRGAPPFAYALRAHVRAHAHRQTSKHPSPSVVPLTLVKGVHAQREREGGSARVFVWIGCSSPFHACGLHERLHSGRGGRFTGGGRMR